MSMSTHEATVYLTGMIEAIQVLHAQARAVADEHGIAFDITFEGGRAYNTTADYQPDHWSSSYGTC
ncbi:hypothetical protein QGX21_gp091 [Pseudomonas phage phiPsa315]|jgi:hypothetical protein|uniref:Uncharacterized protein n=1 Tax=Pseudomonas phage phiPsa315 TaxID=1460363 RepID=A0A7G9V241_9CAUD|nr:hypothetical protein QGX21_gp091 [Pseudomonas phage phiPsa315]QNO00347.1 hypothetical protein phiPsa315_135 [Pseudomonas phage phiPsa315]